ncbi:hypothetical protein KAW04_02655, partial [Candidatus Bathyarchaeota archaeon]|nr:hypothetical protein [Candidatus Bathyarchaeota archaeon]
MKSSTKIVIKALGNSVNEFISKCAQTTEKYIHTRLNDKIPDNDGVPIVLTASMIEMSDFNLNPFAAFSGGFPLVLPKYVLRKKLYPNSYFNEDGTAKFAPYG